MDGGQERIKQVVEDNGGPDGIVAISWSPDAESAEMFAETVSLGDPTYAGALAGVSLKLPVYHVTEPEVRAAVIRDLRRADRAHGDGSRHGRHPFRRALGARAPGGRRGLRRLACGSGMDQAAIAISGLGKVFTREGGGPKGSHIAIQGVDLTVRAGEFFCLLGRVAVARPPC